MKYSSKSQAENGVDNTTVMTPLRVKQSILANASSSPGGSTNYNDLTNKPKINNVELTGNKTAEELGISGNVQADWNTSDPTAGSYIKNKPSIPTKTSDLTNDGESSSNSRKYIEVAQSNPSYGVQYLTDNGMDLQYVIGSSLTLKTIQEKLVSGTNIKTINNQSLLGSGNINIQGGGGNTYYFDGQNNAANVAMINEICDAYDSGNEINFTGKFADYDTGQIFQAPINVTKYTDSSYNVDCSFVSDPVVWLDPSTYDPNNPTVPPKTYYLTFALYLDGSWGNFTGVHSYRIGTMTPDEWDAKQDELVSGTNIKTVNNQSLLGSGNINITAGVSDVKVNNASIVSSGEANLITQSAYNPNTNKIATKNDLPTKTSDLTNDSNFAVDASYVHTDNNYTTTEKNKLAGIEAGAEANVQANWNESDTTSDTYIQNKPTIPTKVSDLQNDSGFITTETDPVFGDSVAYTIDDDDIDYWNDKQPLLVSGQNIKTINNMSILGAGNLLIGEGGIVATDVSINGTSITSDGSANIVTDGAYDPDNNKIATQSTVEAAIGDLIDYVYYQEESFTNPITGTTATEGVVSVGKADNPIQLKLGRNVVKVRLNNSDVVYIGTDTGGKTRIYANNMNALQSIKLGDFSWTKLSDGSIVFGGDE